MTDAERLTVLEGRVNALEALVMMFSGIVLANAPNDPGHARAIGILDRVKEIAIERSAQECRGETAAAVDDLLSEISAGLGLMRKGGQP